MFEDSTFESMGRIHTRSRGWMIVAFTFNASLLLALILIPLIYPEALPRQVMAFLMEAPPPQPAPQTPPKLPENATRTISEIKDGHIFAPSVIPTNIAMVRVPEAPPASGIPGWDQEGNLPAGQNVFGARGGPAIVHQESRGPVHVPSTVVAGLLLQKTIPVYPPIAIAARAQGTVTLEASISKTGTIENLRVLSGPAMLQQAALDAVKTWRYRPYLLNGQPVEVETAVNVVFTLQR